MLKELIKEILKDEITGVTETVNTSDDLSSSFIGKKVMIRTFSAGVHFGTLRAKSNQQVILDDSRRVYSWQKAASLSQLAMEGSKSIEHCKIAMTVKELLLDRVIEVIPLTEIAINNLYGAKEWKI